MARNDHAISRNKLLNNDNVNILNSIKLKLFEQQTSLIKIFVENLSLLETFRDPYYYYLSLYLDYDHTFIIIKQLQVSTNGLINDIQTRLERQSNYEHISSVSSSVPSTNDKCESGHGISKTLIKSKPNLNDVSCENITIAQSNQIISFLLKLKQNNINEFNKILKIWIKMGSYCSKENNIIIHINQLNHEKQQYLLKKLNEMKEKLKRSQNYRLSKLQNVC